MNADLPELNLDVEILVASGDVVGVRLTRHDDGAAGSGLSTRTSWYDGATRTSPANAALFDGDGLGRLATLVEERLAGRPGADRAPAGEVFTTPRGTADALTDVSFTGTGDLALDFDRGAVAVPPAGGQHVVVPRAWYVDCRRVKCVALTFDDGPGPATRRR